MLRKFGAVLSALLLALLAAQAVGVGLITQSGPRLFVDDTPPAEGEVVFDDYFASGDASAWSAFSVGGGTVESTDSPTGQTYHYSFPLTNGTINNFALHQDIGTAGTLSSQVAGEFHFCLRLGFTATWYDSADALEQKLLILQWYDTEDRPNGGGSYTNSNRKYQLIVSLGGNQAVGGSNPGVGNIVVNLLEWDPTTTNLVRTAWLLQNHTYGSTRKLYPNAYNDICGHVVPNTTTSSANLGSGNGNGEVQIWHNSDLIIDYDDVNLTQANATAGMARIIPTSALGNSDGGWVAGSAEYRLGRVTIVTGDGSLLPTQLTAPDSWDEGTQLLSYQMESSPFPDEDENDPPELIVGGGLGGSNAGRIALLDFDTPPSDGNVAGWSDLNFGGAGVPVAWIGMALRWGSDYADVAYGVGGTLKPLLVHRVGSDNDQRLINQMQPGDDGLTTFWYFDNGVASGYDREAPGLRTATAANVNATTDVITISSGNHYRQTGDLYLYQGSSGTIIPELVAGATYAVIRTGDTTFQLAYSYAEAIAGNEINFSGAGSGTHTFITNQSFELSGNAGEWFWVEWEANNTEGVIRLYVTAQDGVCNLVQPTGHAAWSTTGSTINYAAAPCVRKLISQRPITHTTPDFTEINFGFYVDPYVTDEATADSYIDVDQMVFGTRSYQTRAPSQFPH